MSRNDHPLMGRFDGLQNDVTADLVHDDVTPFSAQVASKVIPVEITREFHPTARSSSRTRRIRTVFGTSLSKKYAPTASWTLRRKSSHVSP